MSKNLRIYPSFTEESDLISKGCVPVAGLDESGRGALAGPVVAAAVILPLDIKAEWVGKIDDSKRITAKQREYVFDRLYEHSVAIAIGKSSATEIDRINILEATRLAMKRALDNLPINPKFLLLDALTLPIVPINQKPIIHGDSISLSIAAASIVAKVTRDKIMRDNDHEYPEYGFAKHKGYRTKEHLRNLTLFGPCAIHRFSFKPISNIDSNLIS